MAAFGAAAASSPAEVLAALGPAQEAAAEEAAAKLETAEKELMRAKTRMEGLEASAGSRTPDWTGAYARWDDFEDLDDLESRRRVAEERREKAMQRQAMGCSHDHSAEQAIFDLSTGEKIRACDGFRRHGNAFFREGQWGRALRKYDLSLAYFEYAFPETEEDEQALLDIRVACLLNACLCNLRMAKRIEALNMARQAVAAAPEHAKALFRRAQVLSALERLDEAKADAEAALRLKPGDAEIRRELAIILSKISASKDSMTAISQTFLRCSGQSGSDDRDGKDGSPEDRDRPPGTNLERLLGHVSGQEPSTRGREKLDDLDDVPPDLSWAFDALASLRPRKRAGLEKS